MMGGDAFHAAPGWGPGGASPHFGRSQGPLLDPRQNKQALGGIFEWARVSVKRPSAVLILLKSGSFSFLFEALDPSDAAKDAKRRIKWRTLMQVKSMRCQGSRHRKAGNLFRNVKEAKEPKRAQTRHPKSYSHQRPEGSQNHASPKVSFSLCKIELS